MVSFTKFGKTGHDIGIGVKLSFRFGHIKLEVPRGHSHGVKS